MNKHVAKKSAVSEYLATIGKKGGKASGKARMEKLTPEQRSAVAKKAAAARWGTKSAVPRPRKASAKKARA